MTKHFLLPLALVITWHGIVCAQERIALRESRIEHIPLTFSPSRMAFTADGNVVLGSCESQVSCWDVRNGTYLGTLPGLAPNNQLVQGLVASSLPQWVACSTREGQIVLWNVSLPLAGSSSTELAPVAPLPENGDPNHIEAHSIWFKFSHDGTRLAWVRHQLDDLINDGKFEVHLLALPAMNKCGTMTWSYEGPFDRPCDVGFSRDDQELLFVYHVRRKRNAILGMKRWNTTTLQEMKVAAKAEQLGVFPTSTVSLASFYARDSLLGMSSKIGELILLDVATGRSTVGAGLPRFSFHQDFLLSNDGRHIAVGQTNPGDQANISAATPYVDAAVVIYEVATAKIVSRLPHPGAAQAFPGAFSADGQHLATVVRYALDPMPDPNETRPTHFVWKLDTPANTATESLNR